MRNSSLQEPWPAVSTMVGALFEITDPLETWTETLGPGTRLLHGFALADVPALLVELSRIIEEAPLRQRVTPSGHRMSVAMTNCGALGWVSDRAGYRYAPGDPQSGQPWPPMPARFLRLAQDAAAQKCWVCR